MAVLDLATIISMLKYNFLNIYFVVSVILHLDANLFYLFIVCLVIIYYCMTGRAIQGNIPFKIDRIRNILHSCSSFFFCLRGQPELFASDHLLQS